MSKFHRTASLPHFISAFSNVQFSPALLDLCGYFISKRYRPPTFHVQAWYDEVRDFSYPYEHECNPYCPFRCSGPVCTHYTQVCLGYIILYSSEFVKLTKFSLLVKENFVCFLQENLQSTEHLSSLYHLVWLLQIYRCMQNRLL